MSNNRLKFINTDNTVTNFKKPSEAFLKDFSNCYINCINKRLSVSEIDANIKQLIKLLEAVSLSERAFLFDKIVNYSAPFEQAIQLLRKDYKFLSVLLNKTITGKRDQLSKEILFYVGGQSKHFQRKFIIKASRLNDGCYDSILFFITHINKELFSKSIYFNLMKQVVNQKSDTNHNSLNEEERKEKKERLMKRCSYDQDLFIKVIFNKLNNQDYKIHVLEMIFNHFIKTIPEKMTTQLSQNIKFNDVIFECRGNKQDEIIAYLLQKIGFIEKSFIPFSDEGYYGKIKCKEFDLINMQKEYADLFGSYHLGGLFDNDGSTWRRWPNYTLQVLFLQWGPNLVSQGKLIPEIFFFILDRFTDASSQNLYDFFIHKKIISEICNTTKNKSEKPMKLLRQHCAKTPDFNSLNSFLNKIRHDRKIMFYEYKQDKDGYVKEEQGCKSLKEKEERAMTDLVEPVIKKYSLHR